MAGASHRPPRCLAVAFFALSCNRAACFVPAPGTSSATLLAGAARGVGWPGRPLQADKAALLPAPRATAEPPGEEDDGGGGADKGGWVSRDFDAVSGGIARLIAGGADEDWDGSARQEREDSSADRETQEGRPGKSPWGRSGRSWRARKKARRAERKAKGVEPRNERPFARTSAEGKWLSAIRSLSRKKDGWRDVLVAVEEMKIGGVPMTAPIYHAAMEVCVNQRQPQQALDLFQDLKGRADCGPIKFCYDMALSALRQLRRRDDALAMLEEMKAANFVPTCYTYNQIIRTCRGTDRGLEVADGVLEEYLTNLAGGLESPIHMTVAHNMLALLADAGKWERARRLLNRMDIEGLVVPDTECYNHAMAACRKAGRWREALDLMTEMVRRADPGWGGGGGGEDGDTVAGQGSSAAGDRPAVRCKGPNAESYLHVIHACLKGGRGDDNALTLALIQLRYMRQPLGKGAGRSAAGGARAGAREAGAPASLATSVPRVEMRAVYKGLIGECMERTQRWPQAVELFMQMRKEDVLPTSNMYRSILHVLGRAGRWKEATAVLREAQQLDRHLTEVSYNTVLSLLAGACRLEEAFEVFREMRILSGITPSVQSYNCLLDACEKLGKSDAALKLLEEMYMEQITPDMHSYASAISCCGKASEWEKSLALLVRMQRQGLNPNQHCFNSAINACRLSGEQQKAEQIYEAMVKEGVEPDLHTFNSLIMAYEKSGDQEKALTVLNTMREYGVRPDVYTYGALLAACDKSATWETALYLLDEMKSKGIQPNVVCYTSAISACDKGKQVDHAHKLHSQMSEEGVKHNVYTYSAVIGACARGGNSRKALMYLAEMKSKLLKPDVAVYTAVMRACERRWKVVMSLLEEMEEGGLRPNLLTFTTAMRACTHGGQHDLSMELFDRMRGECGIVPDSLAYNVALEACERSSRWESAPALKAEMEQALVSAKEW